MIPFYQLVDKARAVAETRTLTVPEPGLEELPAGAYSFMEFYCTDRRCDCRRVILQVWREGFPGKVWATLTYGWETPEYYAKWSHAGPSARTKEMSGAMLEQISVQTKLSEPLLEIFRDVVLADPAYVERLKRHYREACPGRGVLGSTEVKVIISGRRLTPAQKRRERLRRRRKGEEDGGD